MPTSSWDAKRKQIAQTMRGTVAPGGLSLGNAGATFRANPMMAQQQGAGGQMAGGQFVPPSMAQRDATRAQFGQGYTGMLADSRALGAGGQPPGLMGQSGGGGQMARMAQMPGFNYVPPPTGPAPVPQQAGMAGAGGVPLSQWSRNDRLGLLTGQQTPNNRFAFNSFQGQDAYDYNRRGRGNGGYTTSGRGWGGGSSSARGGGFGF